LAAVGVLGAPGASVAQTQSPSPLPSLREQAAIQQAWLRTRLDSILPALMRQHEVQMWLVICREYNEDPVFFSIIAPTTFACRRRTMYVFYDRGPGQPLERLALGGSSQGGLFEAVRDSSVQPATPGVPGVQGGELVGQGQWDLLRRVIEARNPRTIAVNISHTHAFADGLPAGEWQLLQQTLGPELTARIVQRERLALDYIALRPPAMLAWYVRLQEHAHDIIRTAFSRRVITPGRTTTDDVVWWTREELRRRGMSTWFQTSVDVQRRGVENPDSLGANPVILPGDVLHIDFGISAMGLKTDTQHMAYVPRPGERTAPAGLEAALRTSNRLQDIHLEEMRPGRTGNEVLHAALGRMRAAGITGSIYSHPIGDHGHGAGTIVGLWDRQDGVPGRGDAPVLADMWYSIELESRSPVSEWDGQVVKMSQEEDAVVGADATRWVLRRQEGLWVVR